MSLFGGLGSQSILPDQMTQLANMASLSTRAMEPPGPRVVDIFPRTDQVDTVFFGSGSRWDIERGSLKILSYPSLAPYDKVTQFRAWISVFSGEPGSWAWVPDMAFGVTQRLSTSTSTIRKRVEVTVIGWPSMTMSTLDEPTPELDGGRLIDPEPEERMTPI